MSQTVEKLAQLVGGTIRGNVHRVIDDAAAIESSGPSTVTFVLDGNHVSRLQNCKAGAVIIDQKVSEHINESADCSWIIVADSQVAFQKILPLFRVVRGRPARGISPAAQISPSAKIGADCYIAPGVHIGDDVVIGAGCDLYPGVVVGTGSRIGEDTILYPNVVLYHDVQVGNHVIIHSGAVIGADGFGYRFANQRFEKIPQLGTVQIQDHVEIGACSTVDRGAVGPTIIGTGTKLDNLVMVAHNCEIGRHNVFASQVGVAGSCTTGDYVRLGGQAGLRDHIHLGTGCSAGAKSGVVKDIPPGETWLGIPSTPESEQKRQLVSIKRIPEIRDDVRDLIKQVAKLTAELEQLKSQVSNDQESIPRRAAS